MDDSSADSRPGRHTREEIERLVRIEQEQGSHGKQIQSLRDSRHDHNTLLNRLMLESQQHTSAIDHLRDEIRELEVNVKSMADSIGDLRENMRADKVRISLIIAGIGFFTGIVSSVVTAVLISRLLS